jgi:hypothetical protein
MPSQRWWLSLLHSVLRGFGSSNGSIKGCWGSLIFGCWLRGSVSEFTPSFSNGGIRSTMPQPCENPPPAGPTRGGACRATSRMNRSPIWKSGCSQSEQVRAIPHAGYSQSEQVVPSLTRAAYPLGAQLLAFRQVTGMIRELFMAFMLLLLTVTIVAWYSGGPRLNSQHVQAGVFGP